jgi:hypothetical protein
MGTAKTLRDRIVQLLADGEDGAFVVPPHVLPALERALERALLGPDVEDELSQVLKLSVALETELESPNAAALIRTLLRSDPRARARLRSMFVDDNGLDEAQRFRLREGRFEPLRASPIDDRSREGGLRIADFLDPRSTGGVRRVIRRR